MFKSWITAGGLALVALAAGAEQASPSQTTTNLAVEVLATVNKKVPGTQDGALRRCQAYVTEAQSAEKLGAKDVAARNWERAARGCKQEANIACRAHKWAAPGGHCQVLAR